MFKKYLLYTPSLFALALLFGCNASTHSESEKTKFQLTDSLYQTLQMDKVVLCPLESTTTLSGRVAFNEEKMVKIYPRVSGTISDVSAQLGDYIHASQKLGVIKSVEMIGLESDIISAQTNLTIAKKNWEAASTQYQNGLISQKELITAELLYQQAEAELKKANEVLKINGGNRSGNYVIKSPISGFIVEKEINNNMLIRPDNAASLFTISDLSNVWVMANVYESEINKVSAGDPVTITTLAYPGREWKAKIDKVFNILDRENKVMKVRIVLPNSDYALKPEMFATITVTKTTKESALCIPSSAVIFDKNQYYVLVAHGNKEIKIVPIQVINKNENKTFISGDIKVNDTIISSNVLLIYGALNS